MSRIGGSINQNDQLYANNTNVSAPVKPTGKDVSLTYSFTPEEVGVGRNAKKPATVPVTEEMVERALFKKFGFDVKDADALQKVKTLLDTKGSPFSAVKTTGSLTAYWNEQTKQYEVSARVSKQLYQQLKGKAAEARTQLQNTQTPNGKPQLSPSEQVAIKNGTAQPNPNVTETTAPVDPNAPRAIKIKVTLPKTNEPLADRALLGYAQQKYGQPNTSLWGENIINIRDLSKLQGVKPQNLKVTNMGDKSVAEFELSPSDAAKMQRNYEAVQDEFNRVSAIADNFRNNNEVASFLRGFGQGVWSALKSNWDMITDPIGTAKSLAEMITNPLETLEGIKKLIGDKWTEFQNADPSKKAEMLGQIAGELTVDALLTKGAGKLAKISKTAELLRGTKIGEQILSKTDEAAAAAKLKLAATFSDEAAAAASQRIKQKLATQLYAGIPADLLADMMVVSVNKIKNSAVKFSEFSRQMVQEFGDQVKPKLLEIYQEATEKAFGARKTLGLDELLGGHSIDKHVGKSESWLRQRLLNEPETKSASSFRNYETANRVVAEAIKDNIDTIERWLSGSSDKPLKLNVIADNPVGIILERGKGGSVGLKTATETNRAEILLVKDNTARGWHVLTSYPSN